MSKFSTFSGRAFAGLAVAAAVALGACTPATTAQITATAGANARKVKAPATTTTTTAAAPTTTAPAPTAPATTGLVSVKDHGARGDGAADDTAAVRAAFAAAAKGSGGVLFPAGTYRLTAVIDIPDAVRVVELASGAVVRQFADDSAFQKVGDVGATQYAVTDARRGQRTISLGSTAGLAPGDWFYFGSDDVFQTLQGFRRGFLRRVEAVSGNTITVDKPLHHSLQTAPRGWEVTLAPSVEIRGGVIEQNDPKTKFNSILHFELVRDPRVVGTEIRNCGAAGVKTFGTVGGLFDSFIHDCLDDESGTRYGSGRHYGYGVELAGATRDLVVAGRSTRTRHAFTTNGAYGPHSDKRLLMIGEPEDIVVRMEAWDTTSSALDTHEPGWNIQFRDCRVRGAGVYLREGSTNTKEGGFGIFIRSRGAVVENCVVDGSAADGITVAAPASGMVPWSAADGTRIRDTQILGTLGKRGVQFHQPAHAERVTIRGRHLVGMHIMSAATGSTARTVSIDLGGYEGSFGVVGKDYVALTDVTFSNVTRQLGS